MNTIEIATEQIVDKQLECRDCKKQFLFSAAEQTFFKEKGLSNQPKRCANCRQMQRNQRLGLPAEQTSEVECSVCSKPTRVPFQPNGHKPVFCNACFHMRRQQSQLEPIKEKELALV